MLFAGLCLAAVHAAGRPAQNRTTELAGVLDSIERGYAYRSFDDAAFAILRKKYLDAASGALTDRQYIVLLEKLADEFHDDHLQLNTNLSDSYRLVPSQTAVLAQWQDGKAVVVDVSPFAPPLFQAVTSGAVILRINGMSTEAAVEARLQGHLDRTSPWGRHWALNSVIAGRRGEPTVIEIDSNGIAETIVVPAGEPFARQAGGITHCDLGDSHYIRFNDSLGNEAVIGEFSDILKKAGSRKVIIDLRNTPGGGNSLVARGILGHFVSEERPYQLHELSADGSVHGIPRRWQELVSPIRPHVPSTAEVLVGRWTGSMGEGLAVGFDATEAAHVAGTAMAGLRGATSCVPLPSLGDGSCLNLPTERLFHVDGTAREHFVPDRPVPDRFADPDALCADSASGRLDATRLRATRRGENASPSQPVAASVSSMP